MESFILEDGVEEDCDGDKGSTLEYCFGVESIDPIPPLIEPITIGC